MMTIATPVAELKNCPIHASWILEGLPKARVAVISDGSSDASAFTVMWDCTAGRFNWFYSIDETVYILEGSVTVTLPSGVKRYLTAGSSFYFGRGTEAQWQVDRYVRKVAFCHEPMSPKLFFAKRLFRAIMRVIRPGSAPQPLLKMFEAN